jgi:ribonuclease HI
MAFYAVAIGHTQGIYNTWTDCKKQIDGFSGAKYKKFETREEAENFISDKQNLNKPKKSASKIIEIEQNTFEPDYYVYTDGSCSNNGRQSAKAGIGIYFGENDLRNVSQPVEGKQTNNTAELTAILKVYPIIEADVKNGKRVAIVSDSEYAIRCVTSYGSRCEKEGWVNPIPNQELVKDLYQLYKDKPTIKFIHIMAHTSKTDIHSLGNDMADKLANRAIGLDSCPYAEKKKIYLDIPYEKKEEAKLLGSLWDYKKKKWYTNSDNPHIQELTSKYK